MTDIGELVVRIKADATQLQQELRNATATTKQSADQMGAAMGTLKSQLLELVPAISAASLIEFTRGALEAANNLYILSQRTGIAGSTLSALNIPLKQNGSSVDEFASSMKFLSRNIELAAEGNIELLKRFDDMGLSVTKLKSLSPEQQFLAWAAALGNVSDQSKLMADAMATGGRGVAGLIPLIKETNGDLGQFIEKAKAAGDALTDEQIKKVHDFDDAWVSVWEHMKIGAVEGTLAVNKFFADSTYGIVSPEEMQRKQAAADRLKTGNDSGRAQFDLSGNLANQSPSIFQSNLNSPHPLSNPAAGNNADLLPPPKDSALKTYISSLQSETKAIGESQRALAIDRAEIEATSKAKEDFNNKLRASPDLTAGEKKNIDQLAGSYYDLSQAQKKAEQQARQMQETIASGLADMATNWKSAGASIKQTIQSIANEMIKARITTPLSQALIGSPNSPGLFDSIFSFLPHFAAGGNINGPSVVGENGPEMFVPPQGGGTIIPNNKLGGSNITVQQTFVMQPGLPETVNAAIMRAAPAIAGMAQTGILQAIQSGGDAAKIVGRRSAA